MKTISVDRIRKLLPHANTGLVVDRGEWVLGGGKMAINDVIKLEILLAPDNEKPAIRKLLEEANLIKKQN